MGIYFVLGVKEGVLEPERYHLERAGMKQLIDWQGTVGVILVQGKQARERSSQEDMIAGAKAQEYVTASDVGRTTSSLHY